MMELYLSVEMTMLQNNEGKIRIMEPFTPPRACT